MVKFSGEGDSMDISDSECIDGQKKTPGDSEPGEFSLYLKFQMLLGIGLFPR